LIEAIVRTLFSYFAVLFIVYLLITSMLFVIPIVYNNAFAGLAVFPLFLYTAVSIKRGVREGEEILKLIEQHKKNHSQNA